ncbi:MAG: adenylate/guanylate cyclase domain-containing protein [Candidatus Rifleibacteriota bacterium]
MLQNLFSPGSLSRRIFLTLFPLIVGSIFFSIAHGIKWENESFNQEALKQKWLNQAVFLCSRARARFSFPLLLSHSTMEVEESLLFSSEEKNGNVAEAISRTMEKYLPREIKKSIKIWALKKNDHLFSCIPGDGLEKSRIKIIEKTFNNLCHLADSPHDHDAAENRSFQKNISSVLGENSAPGELAVFREGKPTPVEFGNQPCYIIWKRLRDRKNQPFAGIFMVLPVSVMENHELGLKLLTNQSLQMSRGKMAIAFGRLIDGKLRLALPDALNDFPMEKRNLVKHLKPLLKSSNQNLRQILDQGRFRFYLDNLNIQSPFTMIIFSTIPGENHANFAGNLTFAGFLCLIFFVFFSLNNRRRPIISTENSFKILFFTTGLIPIFLIGYLIFSQLREAEKIEIERLVSNTAEDLEQIQQQSEIIVKSSGELFQAFLAEPRHHEMLLSEMPEVRAEAFKLLKELFAQRKIVFNYLFINRPGFYSEFLRSEKASPSECESQGNYYAISSRAMLGFFDCGPNLLNSQQKSLANTFKEKSEFYDENIIIDSLERVTAFQTGSSRKRVYSSTLLARNGIIRGTVVLVVDASASVVSFLEDQIKNLNNSSNREFMAISRASNQSFATIPALNDKQIFSVSGRQIREFARSAANSMFPLQIFSNDQVLLYDPFQRINSHFGTAVINISGIKSNYLFKFTLVMILLSLLASTIYFLSSAISHLLIDPLKRLRRAFILLAEGNLNTEFRYDFHNELGVLASATGKMIAGLKQRQILGKFVSNTFDSDLTSFSENSKGQLGIGTVMFSDIRNFTTISEANPPEKVAASLNLHLKEMVQIIFSSGGTVEQFIGDAIVAFFPGSQEKDIARALTAAEAMMKRRRELNIRSVDDGKLEFQTGIGLAFGQVVSGTLTTEQRSEFTFLGEARSNSENLETLSKTGKFSKIMVCDQIRAICVNRVFFRHDEAVFELMTGENK